MKQLSGKAFAKIIERYGWRLLRVHGSHHIYGRPGRQFAFRFRCTVINPSSAGWQRIFGKWQG